MIEPDFDSIFSDILQDDEVCYDFLQILEELLPEACFLMILENGKVLEGKKKTELSLGTREEIENETKKDGFYLKNKSQTGSEYYGIFLPNFKAVLVIVFSLAAENERQFDNVRKLLDNTIQLAELKQNQEVHLLEKEQARKQINILKKQHDNLIEDNYRQYCINQEKEKEYARKLEAEIVRQTSELRKTNRRLKEISRLKSDFLANMSHELRTPMNAILGFADLLAETSLDEEQANYTQTIEQSARSLLELINDILDLAKVEAGKLKLENAPFELPKLINDVTDMFRLQANEKGLEINCEIDEKIPGKVLGDSNRLRQLLVNLTGNAVKFTEKGCVTVRVTYEGERKGETLIKFLVIDTGIGIAGDRIDAVFDNFTQADGSTTREYGGTGLGLSICQQLIKLMKGNLFVSSEPGRGSIFCFIIALKKADKKANLDLPMDNGSPQNLLMPDGRILIAEDNPVNQRLAKIVFERLGYEVEVASDGVETIEFLKHRDFDIVFMDVQMPYLDGREVTRRIREIETDPERRMDFVSLRNKKTPLIIVGLTAHARKQDEEACIRAGMNAFLSKPLVKEKLIGLMIELQESQK